MFVNGLGQNKQSLVYRESSIDASYQVSVHLAMIPLTNMAPQAILVSDWSISKNLLL
jgi:hypothetical protein